MNETEFLDSIFSHVVDGRAKQAVAEVQAALEAGVAAGDILHEACIPAMDEVGSQFEQGEKFVPEMLISAKTMQGVVQLLRPLLVQESSESAGTVLIGTVSGDVHDIGKNLVGMMMEGSGFTVIDLGVDVDAESFVEAVIQHKPQLLGLSALLSTTMPQLGVTIRALEAAGVRETVKVMVGGAPVTAEYAAKMGADAYAADAGSAPRVAKQLRGIV
jgi:methanogenic corrinoid protein MtbC1